ncbi:hypothetical protein NCLIV_007670 [Neospora caninum Liverpool]|uniref:Transporter, major facilitator family protein n=1 Tax=Neospora caninum (strain Liverpool) TaxID=572307 RepID=F0V968_NEOCL|nr:hypothetical protein NCLIV_007670 [Neospora caninum Liverpool]CBZ50293.1 hypothetical protein NCLIV_007670 [Neospora caninum Liverpool]|eukprot:XP_003880327.1 hypothetical protein NCLIV_007670 [Neospora caninum Liverpool]
MITLPLGSIIETRIGPRLAVCCGALIGFSGALGASFAVSSFWAILFLYGLVQGMGAGLQMAPASTVPLRWQPNKMNLLLTLRCTTLILSPCIFIPIILVGAKYSSTPGRQNAVRWGFTGDLCFLASSGSRSDSSTFTREQPLFTSQAYLSFSSWDASSVLQVIAAVTLALQLCGGLLLQNPPWLQRLRRGRLREGQNNTSHPLPTTPSADDSIHSQAGDSPDLRKSVLDEQAPAAAQNRLLPGESVAGFLTRCATLRQAYLAHFIVPFTVSNVSGTAKQLDELYMQHQSVPSWARGLHGISLSLGESIRTERFAFFCLVSCCHFFYFASLYTYWHIAAVSCDVPPSKVLCLSIMLTFFAVLCSLYWGEYTRVFNVGTGLVMTSSLSCASSWLLGMTATSSPAAFTIAVALGIFSAVGLAALLTHSASIAFGPRPLGFVLYLLFSGPMTGGAILSGVTAVLFLADRSLSFTRFVMPSASLLTILSVGLITARCFFQGKLALLDIPVRCRHSDVDSDEDRESCQSPHGERLDLDSSDHTDADDEKRPLNLATVLREYEETLKGTESIETEEADFSDTGAYIPLYNRMQFPVGIEPAHIMQTQEDCDEAELSLSQSEETDPEEFDSAV